jgi:hypothetical protein
MHRTFLLMTFALLITLSGALAADEGDAGLGIILGEPTGLTGKLWLGTDSAVSGAVAWSFADNTRLHVHADWLRHNWDVLKRAFDVQQGELPLYYGIGGRLRFDDDARVGVRFVIGVDYIFEQAPFDIFFEIAPVMDVVPQTSLNGNAALGARIWF